MSSNRPAVLVVGCGHIGLRVARALHEAGVRVIGTSRSPERLRALGAEGLRALPLDLERPEDSEVWSQPIDRVLYAVAAGRGTDGTLPYRDGPALVAERLGDRLRRFVLLSSTGVYAQDDGSVVEEDDPAEPRDGNAVWIRAGERRLLEAGSPIAPTILRLGGLYGPERSPVEWLGRSGFAARLRGNPEAWMNWIREEDAAAAAVAALEHGRGGRIYVAVDGTPVRRREFWGLAAELAGVEPPGFDPGATDLGKRLSNRRVVEELRVRPRFPRWDLGLRSLAPDRSPAPGDPTR